MQGAWCATVFVNNKEEFEPARLCEVNDIKYACWGLERCPETQRMHWHMYMRFVTRKRMESVKRIFARQDMHLEKRRGTEEQARRYCWKTQEDNGGAEVFTDTQGERGEFEPEKGQGMRSDLAEIATKIKAGTSIKDVAIDHPADFIRYHCGIQAFANVVTEAPAVRQMSVLWLHGPSGTGKTHRVMMKYPDIFKVMPGRSPWDAYSNQSRILFEEFQDTCWPIDMMKQYLDKWKLSLDARYANKHAHWTEVYLITNGSPETFYPTATGADLAAFRRRIATSCRYVNKREDEGGMSLEELINNPPHPVF